MGAGTIEIESPDFLARIIVTGQLPFDKWHGVIGDRTYADAVLDRVAHKAHRINLSGDSLRRTRSRLPAA